MNYLELLFLSYFTLAIILQETKWKNTKYYSWYITLILFFSLKWLLDYRKCTFSYIEVKLRGVKKEEGIIYQILEKCMEIRKSSLVFLFYFITLIIVFEYYSRQKIVYGLI